MGLHILSSNIFSPKHRWRKSTTCHRYLNSSTTLPKPSIQNSPKTFWWGNPANIRCDKTGPFTPRQTPVGLQMAEWQRYWFFLLRFTFFLTGFESHGHQNLKMAMGNHNGAARGRDACRLKCCKDIAKFLCKTSQDLLLNFLILPQTPQSIGKKR